MSIRRARFGDWRIHGDARGTPQGLQGNLADTMGAKTDLFPTFSELCATAREVEKKPLSIPPRQIDGKLVLDENFGIFPREFEDYTYSFLLFEAQKIERRRTTDAIISSSARPDSASSARHFTPEQQMESDLRTFVLAQEQPSFDDEEGRLLRSLRERKAPAASRPSEAEEYEKENQAPRVSEDEGGAPAPDGEDAPLPEKEAPLLPRQQSADAPQLPQARPRVLPPKLPMGAGQTKAAAPIAAPQAPSARPPTHLVRQAGAARASEQDASQPYEPIRQQPSSLGAPEQPSVSEGGKKPPAGITSYSKLSPRLQSLIEAKLRREEEKAKKSREDSDIFKTPPPAPDEEPAEAESGQGQEDADAPNAWNVHDEETDAEGAEGVPDARARGKKVPLPAPAADGDGGEIMPEFSPDAEEEAGAREPDAKSQRKPPLRRMQGESSPAQDEGRLSQQDEEEAPAPDEKEQAPLEEEEEREAPEPEEEAQPQSARGEEEPQPGRSEKEETIFPEPEQAHARAGPITIKPLFPDAASGPSQERQAASKADDSDRMRRIQRIIEDLSPDKVRAQPKRDDISFEKDEKTHDGGKAEEDGMAKEPQEEMPSPAPAQQKGVPGRKSKALPLPKSAGAKKRKAVPAQEKEAPKGKQRATPAKKLPSKAKAQAEELPEEEATEAPGTRKIVPALPAREEESEQAETQEDEIPAPKKLAPRLPVREEAEEGWQAPQRQPRKLVPRIPAREEESGEETEEAPAAPARKKLIPRLPSREEAETDVETEDEAPAAQVSPLRRRVLPGMGRTAPSTPQTYVPPARERKPALQPVAEPAQPAGEPEEAETNEAETEEAPAAGEEGASPRLAPLKPRKLVSDEAMPDSEKTPEQVLQEKKMEKMAEQLARLEAGKVKEVAGTAALPAEEEDVPLPDDDGGVPKPEQYEQAKESLRKELEHEETARKVKQEDEAIVEQYAKDRLVWLYEIYKMGGMGREDFLQKASEKYSEAQNAGAAPAAAAGDGAPPNPALAALGKEIEKKDKK
ncbi:MAG: hypothetical protein WCY41_01630 [Candidatus Micrarchaeia archaeon]